ncbi:MAG: TlpA family protein disulfide reductase, partial [Gemmataceae bacterium]|nr:TlpA family protein disulfide reductase [Gemmataceae bacterium]
LALADFRGKVVVVFFWGHWSPACRAYYAKLRELCQLHDGKPFAVLGINSDNDREAAKEILRTANLPWLNLWNGGSKNGPLSTAYKVRAWPVIYVIDQRGVIRARNVDAAALAEVVAKWLAAVEK